MMICNLRRNHPGFRKQRSQILSVTEREWRPQRICRRGRDVEVLVSGADYDRLTRPRDSLVEFLRNSPLAEAMADGKLDLERAQDPIRDLPW